MSATSETATPRKIGGSLWLTQAFASSIRPGKSVAASYGNANRDFTVPEDVVLVFDRYVHKQRYSKATGQSVTRREPSEEQDEVFVPAGTSRHVFLRPKCRKERREHCNDFYGEHASDHEVWPQYRPLNFLTDIRFHGDKENARTSNGCGLFLCGKSYLALECSSGLASLITLLDSIALVVIFLTLTNSNNEFNKATLC